MVVRGPDAPQSERRHDPHNRRIQILIRHETVWCNQEDDEHCPRQHVPYPTRAFTGWSEPQCGLGGGSCH